MFPHRALPVDIAQCAFRALFPAHYVKIALSLP